MISLDGCMSRCCDFVLADFWFNLARLGKRSQMTSVVTFACAWVGLGIANVFVWLWEDWLKLRAISHQTTAWDEVGWLLLLQLLWFVSNVLSVKHLLMNVLIRQYFLTFSIHLTIILLVERQLFMNISIWFNMQFFALTYFW